MEKTTLVLADEDQAVLQQLEEFFTNEGYEVLAKTSNGAELIQIIKNQKPNIVVMDIVLQNCDGFKVLEETGKQAETSKLYMGNRSRGIFTRRGFPLCG